MAKLVITLDGVQVGEVPVDKERISIGRRADNDIQLDHIAVSGQHAAVVTILNDSFLEDLGSTNGTLVNGGAVRKHFLRNGDLVEIGRHRLRFVGEVLTTREVADFEKTMVLNRPTAAPRPAATGDVRTATVSSWSAGEAPAEIAGGIAAILEARPGHVEQLGHPDLAEQAVHADLVRMDHEVEALVAATAVADPAEPTEVVAPPAAASAPDASPLLPQQAIGRSADQTAADAAPTAAEPTTASAPPITAVRTAEDFVAIAPTVSPAAAALLQQLAPGAGAQRPDPPGMDDAPATPAVVRHGEAQARLQVLNGTAAGRILEISKPLTTIGRPAVQVAVISRRSDGYYLAQVDGEHPARLNGSPLVPHAVGLRAHDILEIAGIKLEFFFQ